MTQVIGMPEGVEPLLTNVPISRINSWCSGPALTFYKAVVTADSPNLAVMPAHITPA